MKISILLPTRENTSYLEKAINSILDKSHNSNEIEILLAINNNDIETINFLGKLNLSKINYKHILVEEGEGYFDAASRLNKLAEISEGDILFSFNDDMIMKTDNWDKILRNRVNELPVDKIFTLYPAHNQKNDNWPIAPIITREWYNVIGKFTNSYDADTESLIIGDLLKRIYKVDRLHIHHFNDTSLKLKQEHWKDTRHLLIESDYKHNKSILTFNRLFLALIDYNKLHSKIKKKKFFKFFILKTIFFFPYYLFLIQKYSKMSFHIILLMNFFKKNFQKKIN